MKIKNFDQLAKSEGRKAVLAIAEAGLRAINTESAVSGAIKLQGDTLIVQSKKFRLNPGGRLLVVGVGKCSLEAGAALERVLGDHLSGGIVVDVHEGRLKKIRTYHGTHPLPTEANVDAAKAIIELLRACEKNDFIIFVISGGGSTLLCQPTNFTCLDEAEIFKQLTGAGATIKEINTLRKHLSRARGGHLAQYAFPARSAALIFSDVSKDDLEFVASGPTVKDTTTVEDAKKIIEKYDLKARCGITDHYLVETPKEDKFFKNVSNVMLVSNRVALGAMVEEAKKQGFTPKIASVDIAGEARVVGEKLAEEISRASRKTVLLYGGETTVAVKNPKGRGGRNMELALAAMLHLAQDAVVASVASDGRDNGDFGGAICDIITNEKAKNLGLSPQTFLAENNSYEFFEKVGDYLMLGDTGSNVSDLIIGLK